MFSIFQQDKWFPNADYDNSKHWRLQPDETYMSEMGMGESQKAWKWGSGSNRKPLVGSRGNAPGGGQGMKPPQAEGFF